MSVLDRFRTSSADSDDYEQLAADDPAPRGESRDSGFIVSTFGGSGWFGSSSSPSSFDSTDDDLETVRSPPPADLAENHTKYFKETEFTRAALKIFALTTTEPGYHIGATVDGETDEEMQEALREWASQCAIDACEPGQDLSVLLKQAPILRYSKGTAFLEKAGTEADPDALAALVYHKPETFVQYKQANKSLLVQPDDPVEEDHPKTPSGEAAAYVQYDDSLSSFDDDAIKFSADDIVKLVFDADNGSAWGSSIWDACGDRIDALFQKLEDRDHSIHTVGHGHRVYHGETWTLEEAREYADAHKEGDVSAGPYVDDHSDDRESYGKSWPGRVDFVPDTVDVKVVKGEVPDIDDAVKDDIEAIFSTLPVSKPKIAYAGDINQYTIEPLDTVDELLMSEERQYLETKFGAIIEEKADELAGGEYAGDITFNIEPSESDNPLARESFPRENIDAFGTFLKDYYASGAAADFPPEYIAELVGVDLEQVTEEYGFEPDELGEGAGPPQPPGQSGGTQGEAVTDGGDESGE